MFILTSITTGTMHPSGYHDTRLRHIAPSVLSKQTAFSLQGALVLRAANLNTVKMHITEDFVDQRRRRAKARQRLLTAVPRRAASAAVRAAGLRRDETPTCRIRFWCSGGGGGPPSGDVLLDEAIFESPSEPPPLDWLPSGLLDIPSRAD